MNVVFVGPFALSPKSTMRVRALPIARELVRRGHRVTVLLPPWDNPADSGRSFEDSGVSVKNLTLPPHPRLLRPTLVRRAPRNDVPARGAGGDVTTNADPHPGPLPPGRGDEMPTRWFPALGLRLLRETMALKPDLVHAFKPKGFSGGVAQALLLRGRTPVVVDTDDWEGDGGGNDVGGYPWWQRRLFAYQERWLLRRATAVTAASRTLVEMASALRGPHPDPLPGGEGSVVYVPNGPGTVPVAGPTPPGGGLAPALLLVTRFVESSPERIATILKSVQKRVPQFTLLFVGAGMQGEEARFVHSVRELGIPIEQAGWVPPEQLPMYFGRAGAAIFPMEDTLLNRAKCSVKLVDLMAAGVPVVAEAVGQNSEYLTDRESGLLVQAGDFDAFAEATARLLKDQARARRLGEGARKRIAGEFRWERLVDRVEEAYATASGRARSPAPRS